MFALRFYTQGQTSGNLERSTDRVANEDHAQMFYVEIMPTSQTSQNLNLTGSQSLDLVKMFFLTFVL